MGVLKNLEKQLSEIEKIYNDCYTNEKSIYREMPIESYDNGGIMIRNYLADRLKAQRAIESQTYNEETIKNAAGGLRNMIRAGAKNAPWYSPDIDIAELFNRDKYEQTMFNQIVKHFDVRNVADQYRVFYEGRDSGILMYSVEGLYMSVGEEILGDIALLATYSEPNTYVNKTILAQLKYVTAELDISDIQSMYRHSVKKLSVRPGDEKYTPMIKGVLQEYFKEILLDKDEVVEEYFKDFDKQKAEGKEKDEIPTIGDVIIGKYFEDTDYTKELEENREEFVEDLDKFKEEHSEDEKMLQVKPKGKLTFASIKQAINKVLRRDDKNR